MAVEEVSSMVVDAWEWSSGSKDRIDRAGHVATAVLRPGAHSPGTPPVTGRTEAGGNAG